MAFDASMWQLAQPLALACVKSVLLYSQAKVLPGTVTQPFCKASCDQVKGTSASCMQREWMVAQSGVSVFGCAQGEPTAVQCCK